MSPLTSEWFVRTEFGATLGPMPRDALVEMARSGELVRGDKVWKGTDESAWQLAGDIAGLFDGAAPPSTQPGARIGDLLPRSMPDGSFIMARASEFPRSADTSAPPPNSKPKLASAGPSLQMSSELQALWQMTDSAASPGGALRSPPPQPIDPDESDVPVLDEDNSEFSVDHLLPNSSRTVDAPTRDELAFEVDAPVLPPESNSSCVNAPACDSDLPPEIDSIDFGNAPDSSAVPARIPAGMSDARLVDTAPPRRAVSMPLPRRKATGSANWKRKLLALGQPRWGAVAGISVLLLVIGLWWFWPRHRPDIFARYVAIHDELQKRRENPADAAGLNEYVSHATEEVDTLVASLEAESSNNREQQLLLFLGRDCLREILKKPKQTDERRERQFAAFAGQLKEIYEPGSGSATNEAAPHVAKSDPKAPAGSRVPLPNSVRGQRGDFGKAFDPEVRTPGASPSRSAQVMPNSPRPGGAGIGQSPYTGPTKLPSQRR